MLRRDNVSRRTDESDSKLVVTESLTAHDVFNKGNNKCSGEFIEDTNKYSTALYFQYQAAKASEFYENCLELGC